MELWKWSCCACAFLIILCGRLPDVESNEEAAERLSVDPRVVDLVQFVTEESGPVEKHWDVTIPDGKWVIVTIRVLKLATGGTLYVLDDDVRLSYFAEPAEPETEFVLRGPNAKLKLKSSNPVSLEFSLLLIDPFPDPAACSGDGVPIDLHTQTSLQFPIGNLSYQNDIECTWMLKIPPGKSVLVKFTRLPKDDSVRLYDGELRADKWDFNSYKEGPWLLQKPNSKIMFVTDDEDTGMGFTAQFRLVRPIKACLPAGQVVDVGKQLVVRYPPEEYTTKSRAVCRWELKIPDGKAVAVRFSGASAPSHKLRVFDGGRQVAPTPGSYRARFVGKTSSYRLQRVGSSISLEPAADGSLVNFTARLEIIEREPGCLPDGTEIDPLNVSSLEFAEFENNEVCRWFFKVPAGKAVALDILEIKADRWSFELRDGGELAAPGSQWGAIGARKYLVLRRGELVYKGGAGGSFKMKLHVVPQERGCLPGGASVEVSEHSSVVRYPQQNESYFSRVNCSWHFVLPRERALLVRFKSFPQSEDTISLSDGTKTLVPHNSKQRGFIRIWDPPSGPYLLQLPDARLSFSWSGQNNPNSFLVQLIAAHREPACLLGGVEVDPTVITQIKFPQDDYELQNDMTCNWTIVIPMGKAVALSFVEHPSGELLRVVDSGKNVALLKKTYKPGRHILVQSTSAEMQLVTQRRKRNRMVAKLAVVAQEKGCLPDGFIVDPREQSAIRFPSWDVHYHGKVWCNWEIVIPDGQAVVVTFPNTSFDNDLLNVYDGKQKIASCTPGSLRENTRFLIQTPGSRIHFEEKRGSVNTALNVKLSLQKQSNRGETETEEGSACSADGIALDMTKVKWLEYPSDGFNYRNNRNCTWRLNFPRDSVVSLRFTRVELAAGDRVSVANGSDALEYDRQSRNDLLFGKIMLRKPDSRIKFSSDGEDTEMGFKVEFKLLDLGCWFGGVDVDVTTATELRFPKYDVDRSAICNWILNVPPRQVLELRVDDVELPAGYVSVYDGRKFVTRLWAESRGNRTFVLSQPKATVSFRANADDGVFRFAAQLAFVVEEACTPGGAVVDVENVTELAFPPDGATISEGTFCTWHLRIPARKAVLLHFPVLPTFGKSGRQWDLIAVRPDDRKEELFALNTGSGPYFLQRGATIRLNSVYSDGATGFRAKLQLVEGKQACLAGGSEVDPLTETAIVFSFRVPGGTLNALQCSWKVKVPAGKVVFLELEKLKLSTSSALLISDGSSELIRLRKNDTPDFRLLLTKANSKLNLTVAAAAAKTRFRISLTVGEPPAESSACTAGSVAVDVASTSVIEYPQSNVNYVKGLNCTWNIFLPGGKAVVARFDKLPADGSVLQLESGNRSVVSVVHELTTAGPYLLQQRPAALRLVTDSRADVSGGFRVTFIVAEQLPACLPGGIEVALGPEPFLIENPAEIVSPKFLNQFRCAWKPTVLPSQMVEVAIESLVVDGVNSLDAFDGDERVMRMSFVGYGRQDGKKFLLTDAERRNVSLNVLLPEDNVTLRVLLRAVDRREETTIQACTVPGAFHDMGDRGNQSLSIDFPGDGFNYKNNQNCSWNIKAATDSITKLKFERLELCGYFSDEDSLKIFDGEREIGYYAHRELFIGAEYLTLLFQSGDADTDTGFQINIYSLDKACQDDGIIVDPEKTTDIQFPKYQVAIYRSCMWNIIVAEGKTVMLSIEDYRSLYNTLRVEIHHNEWEYIFMDGNHSLPLTRNMTTVEFQPGRAGLNSQLKLYLAVL